MTVRVAAIDPSMGGTALAVLEAVAVGPPKLLLLQRIASKPAPTLRGRIERFAGIANRAWELLAEHQPELVFIEGYSFASQHGGEKLGELGGILRLRLLVEAPMFEVPPAMLKKWATGKGNANKATVVSAVSQRHGMLLSNDDEADALALAHLAMMVREPTAAHPYPKDQRLVADKLRPEVEASIRDWWQTGIPEVGLAPKRRRGRG